MCDRKSMNVLFGIVFEHRACVPLLRAVNVCREGAFNILLHATLLLPLLLRRVCRFCLLVATRRGQK